MSERTLKRIGWAIAALSVLFAGVSAIFYFLTRGPQLLYWASAISNSVPFVLIGALIVTRLPRNRIGWLFLGAGIWATEALIGACGGYLLSTQTISPVGTWLSWLSSWLWMPGAALNIIAAMLFPTGCFLSPRWRIALGALLLGFSLLIIAIAFYPGEV